MSFNKVILLLEKLLLSCHLNDNDNNNYYDLYYCPVLSFDQNILLLKVVLLPSYRYPNSNSYRDTHHYLYHSSILSLD